MGLCVLIFDGNVKCVLVCYLVQDGYFGELKVVRVLWEVVECFILYVWVNYYIQVMMDFGVIFCMCSKFSCLFCLLVLGCCVYLFGCEVDYLQFKLCKVLLQKCMLMLILVNCDGVILFYWWFFSGFWGGFWSFFELDDFDGFELFVVCYFLVFGECCELSGLIYIFSYFQFVIEFWLVVVESVLCVVVEGDWFWYNFVILLCLGFVVLVKKLFKCVEQEFGCGMVV